MDKQLAPIQLAAAQVVAPLPEGVSFHYGRWVVDDATRHHHCTNCGWTEYMDYTHQFACWAECPVCS